MNGRKVPVPSTPGERSHEVVLVQINLDDAALYYRHARPGTGEGDFFGEGDGTGVHRGGGGAAATASSRREN